MTRGPDKQFDPDIVLAKAMEVFWAKGYEAASLSELLKQMGIGKKSLYDTFGNKRALFLKALAHYGQTVIKPIRDQLSASGSPLGNLKQGFRTLPATHGQPGSKGCMLGTNIADFDTNDAEMAKVLRGYLRELEDIYYSAITRAQTAGELSSTIEPRNLARLLLCVHQGMVLVGRVLEDETLLESVAQATETLLQES
ncbi:MAG: TetR/AcrR family transcriptional regulator [Cyanothece sp. SIO1E1]|nr:TetR/AcrR family transcriptional regulator [Cyanothece sp. SIO1E1]